MARNRIDYGIDLGTTNSALARMELGEPMIRKSDLNHDTIPSCVGWNRKGVIMVGDTALNQLQSDRLRGAVHWQVDQNVFIEFKRTMGTDKRYTPTALQQVFSSEELSAEILKKLKSFVQDENVHAAVITVPASSPLTKRMLLRERPNSLASISSSCCRNLLLLAWRMVLETSRRRGHGWSLTLEVAPSIRLW